MNTNPGESSIPGPDTQHPGNRSDETKTTVPAGTVNQNFNANYVYGSVGEIHNRNEIINNNFYGDAPNLAVRVAEYPDAVTVCPEVFPGHHTEEYCRK